MSQPQNPAHIIERRPPGSWYTVVLGDPDDRELGRSSGTFPAPDFGSACVCCDSDDAVSTNYDPSTGAFVADPIPIPLCAACQGHVDLNEKTVLYIVAAGFIGIILLVLGLFLDLIISGIGALVLAGAAGVLLKRRSNQRSSCQSGHYSGLEIAGTPGVCSVRTMNPRIAQRLVERHQGRIIRVK